MRQFLKIAGARIIDVAIAIAQGKKGIAVAADGHVKLVARCLHRAFNIDIGAVVGVDARDRHPRRR